MTEKQKMLAGLEYDCGDSELQTIWHKAKKLTCQFNTTCSTDKIKLDQILTQLVGSKGENLWITPPFFVDYGENIHFGKNCEVNMNCVFLDCNKITIGDNALIAPGVHIYTVGHPVTAKERFNADAKGDFPFCKCVSKPVTIGHNVWIGGGAIILPGVVIGDNVTIGAGSVVTKSIPANTLALGNPCRVVKSI